MAAMVAVLALPTPSLGATLHVDQAGGNDAATGLSWAEAFATMTRAVDAARAEATVVGIATIKVAAGTYTLPSMRIDFRLVLVGGYPPGGGPRDRASHASVMDASDALSPFELIPGSDGSIIDGIGFTNATSTAIALFSRSIARNVTAQGNSGVGVAVGPGWLDHSIVAGNAYGGVSVGTRDCSEIALVTDSLVMDNSNYGIFVWSDGDMCGLRDPARPSVIVEGNRIMRTYVSVDTGAAAGFTAACCGRYVNNEVVAAERGGVVFNTNLGPPTAPGASISHFTIVDCEYSISGTSRTNDLTISDSILWRSVTREVAMAAPVMNVSNTLSEGPFAGAGNISGTDPLFATGPDGDTYLSQVASGQAADSAALDAGSRLASASSVAFGTTRIDEVRDAGQVDMGFHREPSSYTVSRGIVATTLSPLLSGVQLPVGDAAAIGPSTPSRYYYGIDSARTILLRRAGQDVKILFAYQEFD